MNSFEIKSRLKFISSVQVGDKINVKFMIIQKDSFFTKMSRTVYYENRQNTMIFIKDTIQRTFEILDNHHINSIQLDGYNIETLKTDLENCILGIDNLKQTYLGDVKFCCDLDTIIQEIGQKLSKRI